MSEPAWKAANRAHWDEKVSLHLGPRGYDLTRLRAGRGRFSAIEEMELWPIDGSRILHLQCHFGSDSLKFAQRGATVVGLDFSALAIDAARQLADELGLAKRARFVQADLYDAPAAIPEAAAFDMVFVTWGAIVWFPDIYRCAEIVCHFLSRQSRNQTGGRRQDSSSAVRAILDDPPIHIRPVCSRKRGCEGQEPCGFNAFQHAHGCTPPPPRPQDSSHVLSRVSS